LIRPYELPLKTRMTSPGRRCASPFASHETANAMIAIDSGQNIGHLVSKELPAHRIEAIITTNQTKILSRHRLSRGRSFLEGNAGLAKQNERNKTAAVRSNSPGVVLPILQATAACS
jgi:hypothetical protein